MSPCLPSCIYYDIAKPSLNKSVSLKMLQFVSLCFVPMCLNRRLSIVSKFHLYRIPSEAPRLQSALYFSFSITLSISNFKFSTINMEASFMLLQSLFQFVISSDKNWWFLSSPIAPFSSHIIASQRSFVFRPSHIPSCCLRVTRRRHCKASINQVLAHKAIKYCMAAICLGFLYRNVKRVKLFCVLF